MSSRILVPVSTFAPWARTVVNTVIEMEDSTSATLYLLHVFDEEEKHATADEIGEKSDVSLDTLAKSKQNVAASAETLVTADFQYEIVGGQSDDLGEGILTAASDLEVSRIYLFGRRRSPVGKAVFGSTLQKVITQATDPVVVVPADP